MAGRRREGCRQNRLPWIFLQGDPVRGDPSKTSGFFFKDMIASFRTQANCFFQTVCFSYILIIRIKIWHRFRHPVASSCKLFLSSSLHSQNVFQALSMVGDISRWQLWRPLATMGPVLWEGMQTVMSLSRWQIGAWNINQTHSIANLKLPWSHHVQADHGRYDLQWQLFRQMGES